MNHKLTTSMLAILSACAYAPGDPGWKMNGEAFELNNGNPIYIDANGRESIVEPSHIANLNREAQTHRTEKQKLEQQLKAFEGISDPAKALEALDKMSKIDAKALIDAGEVDKVRETIRNEFTTREAEKDKAYSSLEQRYNGLLISNVFKGSEYLRENSALPLDLVETYFSRNFKVEGDKLVAFHSDGNPVTSKKPGYIGNPAEPEEALQILIEAHPQRDTFLRAEAKGGTGNNGNGGGRGGQTRMTRSEFDALAPMQKAEAAKKQREGALVIV